MGSLSACHMLWMLHLCAQSGVVVLAYEDHASGEMQETDDGAGEFVRVTLRPRMTISDAARIAETEELHERAHQLCFIARSVKFPVEHIPVTVAEKASG